MRLSTLQESNVSMSDKQDSPLDEAGVSHSLSDTEDPSLYGAGVSHSLGNVLTEQTDRCSKLNQQSALDQ